MDKLNQKYYDLFTKLYKSRGVLPKKQYDIMADVLTNEYRKEIKYLIDQSALDTAEDVYSQKVKLSLFVPRTFFIFRNRLARLISKEILLIYKDVIKTREKSAFSACEESDPIADQEEK